MTMAPMEMMIIRTLWAFGFLLRMNSPIKNTPTKPISAMRLRPRKKNSPDKPA